MGAHTRASRHHDTRAGFGCALREGVPWSSAAPLWSSAAPLCKFAAPPRRRGQQASVAPLGVTFAHQLVQHPPALRYAMATALVAGAWGEAQRVNVGVRQPVVELRVAQLQPVVAAGLRVVASSVNAAPVCRCAAGSQSVFRWQRRPASAARPPAACPSPLVRQRRGGVVRFPWATAASVSGPGRRRRVGE